MTIFEIEKGKSEIGLFELNPFELDLFHKGYKIISDFSNSGGDYEYTVYVDVFSDDELYCKIIHHKETYEFEVTYYGNNIPLKTDWYFGGEFNGSESIKDEEEECIPF